MLSRETQRHNISSGGATQTAAWELPKTMQKPRSGIAWRPSKETHSHNFRSAIATPTAMEFPKTISPLMQALPSTTPFTSAEPGEHKIEVLISLPPLIPGHYFASFWIGPHFDNTFDQQKEILSFEVLDSPSQGRTVPHTSDHGFIVPESSYRCEFNATSNSPA